jgi:hypothetical protein
MANTGLWLGRVSVACMAREASGRPLPEHHDDTVCVGRLQPDLYQSLWKIAIVEMSRPMDDSSEQLAAAHERKMLTYTPLLEALKVYLDEGWQVEIFPWVVIICGFLNSAAIKSCLQFLAVPRQRWERIIGVSKSLLFSTPSAMQSPQTRPKVHRTAQHKERCRGA